MTSIPIDPSLYADSGVQADASPTSSAVYALADYQAPHAEQVNEVLKRKRKSREHRACYPCRQRKVKCDLSRPCKTCRDRDHPQLCNYEPPAKRVAIETQAPELSAGATVVLARNELDLLLSKLDGLEAQINDLRQDMVRKNEPALTKSYAAAAIESNHGPLATTSLRKHREVHGLHSVNSQGMAEHFGAGSIPAMLEAMKESNDSDAQAQLRDQMNASIVPLFGLDEETTYPFIDLWSVPHASNTKIQELAKVIPDDARALQLWHYYRDVAYMIFPGLADIEAFEQELNDFLVNRAAQLDDPEAVTKHIIFGKSYYWLGLLFAVLASGAQFSYMSRKQRILTSQVYTCCAMECMKLVNFISRPNLQTIQTLVIIQSVLADNMSASTAWNLLGLTMRLGHGLGLHQPCPLGTSLPTSRVRSRIWWALLWQDSLLSIVYDRAGNQMSTKPSAMPMPTHLGNVCAFHQAMYKLAKIALDIVHDREQASSLSDEARNEMYRTNSKRLLDLGNEAPHLRNLSLCGSLEEYRQYWYLKLHSSYCQAELCRPGLLREADGLQQRQEYYGHLLATIQAFVGLWRVSPLICYAWASVHRALSSALLLGILEFEGDDSTTISTIADFLNAVEAMITDVDPQEVSGPIKRGILALYQLQIPGVVFPPDLVSSSFLDGVGTSSLSAVGPEPASEKVSPYMKVNSILWSA